MRQQKQLSLIKEPRKNTKLWWIKKRTTYGGSFNYRKVARPFDSKKLVHVVFKARLGKGIWFSKSQPSITKLLNECATRYHVTLRDLAINKDHIHLLIHTKEQNSFTCFLRLVAAELGRKYKGIFSRFGFKKPKNFWLHRPFSRLVNWGKKSLQAIHQYIKKNRDEVLGFVEYTPRKHQLNKFLADWESEFH